MLVRAVHFGSCLVLQSVFAVLFLAVIPAWNQSGGNASRAREHFYRLLRRLLGICLLAAFASGFLWLWFTIASMSGASLSESLQPSLLWMVLTETQPGHVWMLRTGIALVFAVALFLMPGTPRGAIPALLPSSLCALSATLLTASLAWLGHAGAGEGPHENLQLAGDLLHLIAAGIWPAGLVPFVIFLRCFLKTRDPAALLAACVATRRFSALSLFTVGILVMSGIANSYFLVGTLHAFVSTDYGLLLLLKLALFTAAVAIGAWNLLRLTPRLAIPGGSLPQDAQNAALAKVVRNVLIEIALGALILLVIGLLGIMPPAIHS
jgi:putative copper resistance protein D